MGAGAASSTAVQEFLAPSSAPTPSSPAPSSTPTPSSTNYSPGTQRNLQQVMGATVLATNTIRGMLGNSSWQGALESESLQASAWSASTATSLGSMGPPQAVAPSAPISQAPPAATNRFIGNPQAHAAAWARERRSAIQISSNQRRQEQQQREQERLREEQPPIRSLQLMQVGEIRLKEATSVRDVWTEMFVCSNNPGGLPLQHFFFLGNRTYHYINNTHIDKGRTKACQRNWLRKRKNIFLAIAHEVGKACN